MTERPEKNPGQRRYRATVRTRIALTYSALLTGAGVVMLGVIYLFMRFVPTYDLVPSSSVTAAEQMPDATLLPSSDVVESTEAAVSTPANELLVTSADQMLNLLLGVSAVVLVVLAVTGVAVGWAVAGRMLRPLQYINGAVHTAASGDLQHRIGMTGPRDEISELASNVDHMLAQLDSAFSASRRFASNASHELLTPLAASRAMLDVAIAQQRDPAEREVFDRLRTMNERSIETAEALLDLAQIDARTASTETVDLATISADVVQSCAQDAADGSILITTDLARAEFRGDAVLTRQLVTNVVHNAIRHNLPSGGFVTVTTASSSSSAVLIVENSGAQLDPDTVDGLIEPFSRAEGRSAASSTRGHGLGLSIVSAIVTRFRGDLVLEARRDGGLRVTVTVEA